jgi:hypothetical protein
MTQLSLFVRDCVRGGLAVLQSKPANFWETPAARLEDAQARFVAERVRELALVPASGDGWPDRLLDRLSRLHLLAEGYSRIDMLPPPTQADIRTQIGWAMKEDDVLASGETVRDQWIVFGSKTEVDGPRRSCRTWLWGQTTDRPALLLAYAYAQSPMEPQPQPGTMLDADLTFYPAAYPLRATIRKRHAAPVDATQWPSSANLLDATARYAAALSANPWMTLFPLSLSAATPIRQKEQWLLRDADGRTLPISRTLTKTWELLALSGGHAIPVFAEWDGEFLTPMSAWSDGRFCVLSNQ